MQIDPVRLFFFSSFRRDEFQRASRETTGYLIQLMAMNYSSIVSVLIDGLGTEKDFTAMMVRSNGTV